MTDAWEGEALLLLLKGLLAPLAFLYGIVITLRNWFYDRGWLAIHSIPTTVISVGNITVGGTGKTPVTMALVEWLRNQGYAVAILSRGYGRETKGPVIASTDSSWREIGDEPAMMLDILKEIPMCVDENRYRGGRILMEKFQPDIIIMDDAFQHRSLRRDVDLLVINAGDRPSDHHLFPWGKLREPWRSTRRADAVLLTKTDWYEPSPELKRKMDALSAPIFRLTTQTVLHSPYGPIEACDLPFLLVCAIADPESFRRAARAKHLDIAGEFIFHDHYQYQQSDVDQIEAGYGNRKTAGILTTEKDYVKLKRLTINMPVYVLSFRYSLSDRFQEYLLTKALS